MKSYTLEELGDTCPEAIMIGSEDERKAYLPAIIGIAKDNSFAALWIKMIGVGKKQKNG